MVWTSLRSGPPYSRRTESLLSMTYMSGLSTLSSLLSAVMSSSPRTYTRRTESTWSDDLSSNSVNVSRSGIRLSRWRHATPATQPSATVLASTTTLIQTGGADQSTRTRTRADACHRRSQRCLLRPDPSRRRAGRRGSSRLQDFRSTNPNVCRALCCGCRRSSRGSRVASGPRSRNDLRSRSPSASASEPSPCS